MPYAYNPNPKKSAQAHGRALRISPKSSVIVCRAVSGMRLEKGKALLQDMLDEKRSLSGKYYTNVTRELLRMVRNAEANAEAKGLDTEKMHIKVSAHQGFKFYRPRSWKRRREKRKVTNLQVVLEAG